MITLTIPGLKIHDMMAGLIGSFGRLIRTVKACIDDGHR